MISKRDIGILGRIAASTIFLLVVFVGVAHPNGFIKNVYLLIFFMTYGAVNLIISLSELMKTKDSNEFNDIQKG